MALSCKRRVAPIGAHAHSVRRRVCPVVWVIGVDVNAPATSKPWFSARRLGFGWRPVTWQGWVASGVFVALVIGVTRVVDNSAAIAVAVVLLVGLLALVCYLTGGKPGPLRPDNDDQTSPGAK